MQEGAPLRARPRQRARPRARPLDARPRPRPRDTGGPRAGDLGWYIVLLTILPNSIILIYNSSKLPYFNIQF